jgi:hypothetical protein
MGNISIYFILVVGLITVLSGIYLSWHKKGNEAWATYLFGFLLVVLGGPLGSKIDSLSLTNKGVDLSFSAVSENSEEVSRAEIKAVKSLINLQKSEGKSKYEKDNYNKGEGLQSNFLSFFKSLGYIPSQIVGYETISPGTLIKFENGTPIILATQQEAFGGMNISTSNTVLPSFDKNVEGETQILKKKATYKARTSFECTNSTVKSTSVTSLNNSIDHNIIAEFKDNPDIFVVYETVNCDNLRLKTSYSAEQNNEDTISSNSNGVKTDEYMYMSEDPVVLGYKLMSIDFER